EPLSVHGDPVPAEFTEAPFDAELARAVSRVWGTMTLEARWPSRDENIRSMHRQTSRWGAPQYTFDYWGAMVHGQGMTAAPDPGTCAAELVEIGELLIRF